jgi:hypothetical protein
VRKVHRQLAYEGDDEERLRLGHGSLPHLRGEELIGEGVSRFTRRLGWHYGVVVDYSGVAESGEEW